MLIEDYFDDGPIPGCDCADCENMRDAWDEQDFTAWEAEVS